MGNSDLLGGVGEVDEELVRKDSLLDLEKIRMGLGWRSKAIDIA